MEPAPRIELGPPPYRGGVLPLSPSRHEAGGPGFGPGLSRPKRDGLPLPQPPSEPPSGADPDLPPYKGRAAAVRGGAVRSAGLEPATSWLSTKPLCQIGVRAQESRHRVPTPVSCLTRARSQPCVTAWLPGEDSNLA